MKLLISLLFAGLILTQIAYSQNVPKDRGIFIEPKNEFMDSIRNESARFNKKEVKPGKAFNLISARSSIRIHPMNSRSIGILLRYPRE